MVLILWYLLCVFKIYNVFYTIFYDSIWLCCFHRTESIRRGFVAVSDYRVSEWFCSSYFEFFNATFMGPYVFLDAFLEYPPWMFRLNGRNIPKFTSLILIFYFKSVFSWKCRVLFTLSIFLIFNILVYLVSIPPYQ